MAGKAINTKAMRVRNEDYEWIDQMRRQLVKSDGVNRVVSDVLHTILKNARALANDELELLQEG